MVYCLRKFIEATKPILLKIKKEKHKGYADKSVRIIVKLYKIEKISGLSICS